MNKTCGQCGLVYLDDGELSLHLMQVHGLSVNPVRKRRGRPPKGLNLSVEEYINNLFVGGKVTSSPDTPYIFAVRIDHVDADTMNALMKYLYAKGYANPLVEVRPSGKQVSVRVFLR